MDEPSTKPTRPFARSPHFKGGIYSYVWSTLRHQDPKISDYPSLSQLLGYRDYEDYVFNVTAEKAELLRRMSEGKAGYVIFKCLLVKHGLTRQPNP